MALTRRQSTALLALAAALAFVVLILELTGWVRAAEAISTLFAS
jgi:hypothetical protein